MNVPKLPLLGKRDNTEYFLSLVLRDEKVSAVIFTEAEGRINVVGEHYETFKTGLEDATTEELLDVIDRTISTAEKSLPPEVESHKTIFGVKQDWTTNGKISQEYLLKLKKISDELDLKPMGFLVVSEAIAHLLQKEEGAPISAVLAEIGSKSVTLSLIKAGKVIETESAPLEDGTVKTVDKLLHHFRVSEILPSRIILYDGGRQDLQQEFIAHSWSKVLPFLHVPQVITLSANFDSRAVLNGAATQMGFSVLEGTLTKAEKEDKAPVVDDLGAALGEEDKTIAEAASEFGFSEKDVKTGKAEPKESRTEEEAISELDKQKLTEGIKEEPKTAVDPANQNIRAARVSEIPEELAIKDEKRQLPVNAAAITAGFLGVFGKIHLRSLFSAASASKKRLLIVGIPLILIMLIIFVYVFARTATVTLDITNKTVSKSESVTFSSSKSTNADKNIIGAEFVTVSEDGKITTSATGKKQTGDKAKGSVTIFNNSDQGITLPTGTTITSSNNLNFTLDKPVTVASASGDVFSGTKPGTGTITVTAEKFGTNYNLPSGTKFDVKGNSDVAAKNDNAFSGGTTKNVQVVAQADLDKLAGDLTKQLETNAKSDINKKNIGDTEVLPNFISETFSKKSYSQKLDDEATDVALTATISYEGISYKKSDIESFATKKLGGSNNLTVNNDQISLSASGLKQKGNDVTGNLTIKAGLIPQIDTNSLAGQIKGKSLDQATNILNNIPQLEHASITIFPPIPLLPNLVPFSSGKIKIVVNKNG